MKFYAIIGANWGSEGKGLVTDYICAKAFSLNILTNGGVNRNHTVVAEGKRHIFRHFGAGTFAGADTYCHKDFILNPYYFVKEYKELFHIYRDIGKHLFLWNENCRWSTPYDMITNMIISENLKTKATSGLGIWETILRYEKGPKVSFSEFYNFKLEEKIKFLKTCRDWLYFRLKENNIIPSHEWIDTIESDLLVKDFISDCEFMYLRGQKIEDPFPLIKNYQQVVFENGQGLQLNDCGEDDFEKTPSKTGLRNIVEFVAEYTAEWDLLSTLEAVYVTRSYFTKHGDGLLPGEVSLEELGVKEDTTNIQNVWQGKFRVAPIIPGLVSTTIWSDFRKSLKLADIILESGIIASLCLAITHTDEIEPDEELKSISSNVLLFNSKERKID